MVRKSLKPEVQCVQAIHAATKAVHHLYKSVNNLHVVLLSVEDPYEEAKKLDGKKIAYKIFVDSDIGPDTTALATEPIYGEKRKVFSNYPLVRFNQEVLV